MPNTNYLQFAFDKCPFWSGSPVDITALLDDISKFLDYFKLQRPLPNQKEIFQNLNDRFVYEMCLGEREGEQTLSGVMAVRECGCNALETERQWATWNMFKGLEFVENFATEARREGFFYITVQMLCEIHKTLSSHCPEAHPGILRSKSQVEVGCLGHRYPNSIQIAQAVQSYCDVFNELTEFAKQSSKRIEYIIKLASWSLSTLLAIHPWTNFNGRTSRLFCHFILSSLLEIPVPIRNAANESTGHFDFLRALIISQNCRCTSYFESDSAIDCLSVDEIYSSACLGTLATMILEAFHHECQQYFNILQHY